MGYNPSFEAGVSVYGKVYGSPSNLVGECGHCGKMIRKKGEPVRWRYEGNGLGSDATKIMEHGKHSQDIVNQLGVTKKVGRRYAGAYCAACGKVYGEGERIRIFDDGSIECPHHVFVMTLEEREAAKDTLFAADSRQEILDAHPKLLIEPPSSEEKQKAALPPRPKWLQDAS